MAAASAAPAAATMDIEGRVVMNGGGGRSTSKPGVGYQPPEGKWKDGLFACANQIAPSCVLATCLPCVGLALVAQRVGWSGDPPAWGPVCTCPCTPAPTAHFQRTMLTFSGLALVMASLIVNAVLMRGSGDGSDFYEYFVYAFAGYTIYVFTWFLGRLVARTRQQLRLPPLCGGGQEDPGATDTAHPRRVDCRDFCTSLVCSPLVLARLLRHLFDFKGVCDARWPLRAEDAETIV